VSKLFLAKDMARRRDFLNNFEVVVSYAIDNRIELMVISGDLFDSINPRNPARDKVMDLLNRLQSAGTQVVCISGTHDTPKSLMDAQSPIMIYKTANKLYFLKKPGQITSKQFEFDGISVTVAGISPNFGLPEEANPLENLPFPDPSDVNLFLYHGNIQGLPGAAADRVLKRKDIPPTVDYVAGGHIHNHAHRERVNAGEGNTTTFAYCGSTEFASFGEDLGVPKGFYVIEFGKDGIIQDGLEFVEIPTRPVSEGELRLTEDMPDIAEAIVEYLKANADPEMIFKLVVSGEITTDKYVHTQWDAVQRAGIEMFFHFIPDYSGVKRDTGTLEISGESVRPLDAYRRYIEEELQRLPEGDAKRDTLLAIKAEGIRRLEANGAV
jgi:DNA repair exonuclease SbcCD nuclease subunit